MGFNSVFKGLTRHNDLQCKYQTWRGIFYVCHFHSWKQDISLVRRGRSLYAKSKHKSGDFHVLNVPNVEAEQSSSFRYQPRGLKIRGSYPGKSKKFISPPQRPHRLLRLHSLLVSWHGQLSPWV